MRVDLFDFELPEERIALRPANPRDVARLLIVRENGAREHALVRDLPELLRRGDVLVVNDTKVVPARLTGRREARDGTGAGAEIEVTLTRRLAPGRYRALARPAKRLKPGDIIRLGNDLHADVRNRNEGEVELAFDRSGTELDAAIAAQGAMPLPPYIAGRRAPDERDRTDYQTIFAREDGSVAAPTAGLHFTPELFARLARARHRAACRHAACRAGNLSAGYGERHLCAPHACRMGEAGCGDGGRAERAPAPKAGRIVAVGTTTLRTLETAADERGQFEPLRARPRFSSRRVTASRRWTC